MIGEKCSGATEFYDNLIACDFIKMSPITQKLVNQIGDEILQVLKGK